MRKIIKKGLTPTPGGVNPQVWGFTLIELLVVISIIAFLTVAAVVTFNVVRMNSRDATRAGNVATVSRALAMYLNDSTTGYPTSIGECLSDSSSAGQALIAAKVIVKVPVDILWPAAAPSTFNGGTTRDYAVNPSSNFCYWYYATAKNYYLSYYLESNSKSGSAGIHVSTPAGTQ